jgi:CBS domain-containing protein
MKQQRLERIKEAGENSGNTLAHVGDLMTRSVITVTRHQTVGHVQDLMSKHGIHAIPVVNADGAPVGVVTTTTLIDGPAAETLLGKVMNREVYSIPEYSGLHLAARMMRNHGIHHLLVTHEKKVVGILSTFDLLKLIEDRRFTPKTKPTPPKNGRGRRRQSEDKAKPKAESKSKAKKQD